MKWEKFEEGYSVPVKSWCEECDRAMDGIASERDLVEPLVRLVPLASLKG